MDKASSKVVMVSACLLGDPCRYDGGSKPVPELPEHLAGFQVIPFCPEKLGGLTVPRPPAEIPDSAEIPNSDGGAVLDGRARVMGRDGRDCTQEFVRGARFVLEMVGKLKPCLVILKANSPSCGAGRIYDGSFSGRLREGDGVTAALLKRENIPVATENDCLSRLAQILSEKASDAYHHQ